MVRQVFPALRKKLRQRHVELVDVDLRWGITEEEAQQGAVLPICLAEIDKSRPFFLGLLAERYGWVPEVSSYAAELLQEQEWLQEHVGGKSVTELEILHGVLNNPAMAGQAFFYFRDPQWSASQNHPDYLAENAESAEKLTRLKQRIRQSAFPVVEDYANPKELAEQVEQQLWAVLDKSYPESETPDLLSRLSIKHEAYAAPRRRLFLGAEASLSKLQEWVDSGEQRLVISGPSGNGKSALLANWAQRHRQDFPKDLLIEHYLGVDSDAANPGELLRRLLGELGKSRGVEPEIPKKARELYQAFEQSLADWAQEFAGQQGRRLLLLLDGLNQHSGETHLPWLPQQLPKKVLMVASSLPGETLQVLQNKGFTTLELPALGPAQRKQLAEEYLATYRKHLTQAQLSRLSSHPMSGNPLFLRTLLRELRLYGVFEELEQKLVGLLEVKDLTGLFSLVLERMEADLGEEICHQALSLIWASRSGLALGELQIVGGLSQLQIAQLQLGLDQSLLEREGRLVFSHQFLQLAVEERYLARKGSIDQVREQLVAYFDQLPATERKAEELPYQLVQLAAWDQLESCLTDPYLFPKLSERGYLELLGWWLKFPEKKHLEDLYQNELQRWSESIVEVDLWNILSFHLASFLSLSGYQGDFLINLFRRVIQIKTKKLEKVDFESMAMLSGLAHLLAEREEFDEAEKIYSQVIQEQANQHGPEHPLTLISYSNLGRLKLETGELEEAEKVFRKILAVQEPLLGTDHTDTLTTLNNLALILLYEGVLDEAEEINRRILQISQRLLGSEHPDTLTTLNNLAGILSEKGELEEAEKVFRKILAIQEHLLGTEHPATLTTLNNLAEILLKKGELEETEKIYRQILKAQEIQLGSEHHETVTALNNLAFLLFNRGEWLEAEEKCHRVLKIQERQFGPEHPETLITLNNLAELLSEKGELDEAEKVFRKILAVQERLLGIEHREILTTLNNLANLLEDRGELGEAEKYYLRNLKIHENILGSHHLDTLTSLQDLSVILRSQKKFTEAEKMYLDLIQRWQDVDTPFRNTGLGSAWCSKGRLEAAQERWQEVTTCCQESWTYLKEINSEPQEQYDTLRLWSIAAAELGDWEMAQEKAKAASTQAEEIGEKEILEEAQQTLTQIAQRIVPEVTT